MPMKKDGILDRMNRIAPRRMQRLPLSVLHPVHPI